MVVLFQSTFGVFMYASSTSLEMYATLTHTQGPSLNGTTSSHAILLIVYIENSMVILSISIKEYMPLIIHLFTILNHQIVIA